MDISVTAEITIYDPKTQRSFKIRETVNSDNGNPQYAADTIEKLMAGLKERTVKDIEGRYGTKPEHH